MRNLVILGAGTAGTMILNKLRKALPADEWKITIIDRDRRHYYQPGFLFIPFGIYRPEQVVRDKTDFFPPRIEAVFGEIARIDADSREVLLENGSSVPYDYLIVATGCRITPSETEGLQGKLWRDRIFDFYTFEGAVALAERLRNWNPGGNGRKSRFVIHITEMPIKCPVAPLEFAFLADDYFRRRGLRDQVELSLVTPLPGAFTKARASQLLGGLLAEKQIKLVPEFNIARVDEEGSKLMSYDEQEVPFDLLVTIPTNKGSQLIADSGLGDELDYLDTDKHTLRSKKHPQIFAIGDATNLPSSKAGSVAHFQAEILERNILDAIAGREPSARFDGHANCFIESGGGKAFLIDFNYETEPLPGTYPLPALGPFSLLKETRANHLGKMAFKWAYWNLLLPGRHLPVSSEMSMSGKRA